MRYRVGVIGMLILNGCGAESWSAAGDALFSVEELARFGSQFEDGAALTSVLGVVPTEAEVFVLESRPARVAVFSRDGSWLRDVGRAGEGPGEFRRPTAIGVSNDFLWVGDPPGGRVEVFTLRGEHVRSVRWAVPADSLGAAAVPVAILSDGGILAGPTFLSVGAVVSGALTHRNYFRASESGADPILLYTEKVVRTDFMSAEVAAGSFILGGHPHMQSPLVRAFPDGSGLLVVERYAATIPAEASFRVQVVDPDGTLSLDREVPYRPVSAEGWRDRYLADMAGEMMTRSGSVDRTFLAAVEGALANLTFYPPVTEVVAGSDRSIWLRGAGLEPGRARWEVFAADGQALGHTDLPSDLTILRASLEEVWAVELDELDVPFVVNFRIIW